jgi:hypothetical protein
MTAQEDRNGYKKIEMPHIIAVISIQSMELKEEDISNPFHAIHTFKFLTWWGHPAGIKTASPSFCSNVQGSTPTYSVGKKTVSKSLRETLSSKRHHYS